MPIKHSSNNRILPANQRAVDVARQSIADLSSVEQRRYHNAFAVEGYECVVYNSLRQGLACSCQAHGKVLATVLNEDGKMPVAKQNELLTGMSFKINASGSVPSTVESMRETLNKPALARQGRVNEQPAGPNVVQPPIDVLTTDESYEFATLITGDDADAGENDFGSNGGNNSLDDILEDFDGGQLGSLGDTTCAVCFGRGYVGGFSVLAGWRQILSTQWPIKEVDGFIEVNKLPHKFAASKVVFQCVLPRGFLGLDRLQVWNNTKPVSGATIKIDDIPVTYELMYQKFDGMVHSVEVGFEELEDWTHLEFQVDMGNQARLEFPKTTKGFDPSKIDGTEAIQIIVSPVVPHLDVKDLIVESTFGKTYLVSNVESWNTQRRNVLGWSCQSRVVQPNELLNLLPRRAPIQHQKPTHVVRDNVDGKRRT